MDWSKLSDGSGPGSGLPGPPPPPGMKPTTPAPTSPRPPAGSESNASEATEASPTDSTGDASPERVESPGEAARVASETLAIHDADEMARRKEVLNQMHAVLESGPEVMHRFQSVFHEDLLREDPEALKRQEELYSFLEEVSGTSVGMVIDELTAKESRDGIDRVARAYLEIEAREEAKRQYHEHKAQLEIDIEEEENRLAGRTFSVTPSEIEKEDLKIEWLLEGFMFLDGLGQLVGPSGSGKTKLAVSFALAVANGDDEWMGVPLGETVRGVGGPVLYFAAESTFDAKLNVRATLLRRRRLGMDCSLMDNLHITNEQSMDWNAEVSVERLERGMRGALGDQKPALVIMDTQIDVIGDVDENSADIGKLQRVMRSWAVKNECFLLLIHHTGLSASDRGRGSSSQKGKMDVQWVLKASDDDDDASTSEIKKLTAPKVKGVKQTNEPLFRIDREIIGDDEVGVAAVVGTLEVAASAARKGVGHEDTLVKAVAEAWEYETDDRGCSTDKVWKVYRELWKGPGHALRKQEATRMLDELAGSGRVVNGSIGTGKASDGRVYRRWKPAAEGSTEGSAEGVEEGAESE